MSNKQLEKDISVEALKSEAAQQRWQMFHRAIAYAKEVNNAAMYEADAQATDAESNGPAMSIVR